MFLSLFSIGQTTALTLEDEGGIANRFGGIRLAFFSDNFVHPGARLGASIILTEKEKAKKYLFSRKGKKGSKMKIIQYLLDGNAGYYNHPNNHIGIMGGLGITRMATRTRNGFTTSMSLEGNYLNRRYNIPTYEIDGNGELSEVTGAGNSTMMLSFAPGIGKLVQLNSGKSLHFYGRQHIQLFNYDFGIFPNAATEIGLSLSL